MRVKLYSFKPFEQPEFDMANHRYGHQLDYTSENLNLHSAASARGFEAVSIFSNDDASAPVLAELHKNGVKYLALRSAGYNHVDLEVLEKLGMKAANVPAYSPHAIAEHAIALLLAVIRKLKKAQFKISNHDYTLDGLTGFDLYGKTAGVIGTGHIGAIVAKILTAFGCNVLAYDICEDAQLAQHVGISYTTLEEIYTHADVISLHVPLNKQTKYMIGEKELMLMKPGIVIVNTARGGVVQTHALINALLSGHVGGYGMDVFERESGIFFYDHSQKPIDDRELLILHSLNNVVITAHQAFLTREALHGIAETTLQNITEWDTKGASSNDLRLN